MFNNGTIQKISLLALLLAIMIGGFFAVNSYIYNEKQGDPMDTKSTQQKDGTSVEVIPISHATLLLQWNNTTIYVDPVGDASLFSSYNRPDIILITDIHGDHLNAETLASVITDTSTIIAPQAVADALSESMQERLVVIANGEKTTILDLDIEALPMYNLPQSDDAYHTKGRGNGYVIEHQGTRVYIAGDTEDIDEMRALQNIDIAFIPMNLPYTMDAETAADAVLDFKPRKVYPYHYRGPEGFGDIAKFKSILEEFDPSIEVVLHDWYPAS